MNGSKPTVSGRTSDVQNAMMRGIVEAIEHERVRQNIPMEQFMDGAWNNALRHANGLSARNVCRALDALDIEVIFINKEGEQV